MILRHEYLDRIKNAFLNHRIVALLGPRQCGKTTLAKKFASTFDENSSHFFDMEDPLTAEQFKNPNLVLDSLNGIIILDEIQLASHLFPLLRVLADKDDNKKYLILGSASPDLIKTSSQTLAGRIAYIDIYPFNIQEIDKIDQLFIRGGYPKSYLANTNNESWVWRENYIRTFLERDLPQLGLSIPAAAMRRFWMMLSHYHGQIFNASEIGKSLGVSDKTIKGYLDILTGTYMLRQLQPWYENISKRQVKRSKIYFRDTGIYNFLNNIENSTDLFNKPHLGALWEGFALEQIIQSQKYSSENCFFWSIHNQAEIDLFVLYKGKRIGFEFKYADIPKMTKSMHMAKEILKLDEFYVVYPGKTTYKIDTSVIAKPLSEFKNIIIG